MSALMETATETSALAQKPRFEVGFAVNRQEVLETQQLRYRIFAGELGAKIDGGRDTLPEGSDVSAGAGGIDHDQYDPFCRHLLVRETETGKVIACTRILTSDRASDAGGFYSESEFDLAMLDSLPGRVMEIGRTCVDAEYRSGAVIATLWQGIASYIVNHGYDYLFGCASIGLEDGGAQAHAILEQIRAKHLAPERQRVRPFIPLPAADLRPGWSWNNTSATQVPAPTAAPTSLRSGTASPAHASPNEKFKMPPLLKAYLSLGAKACGEAYWDRDFNCADVFMLLNVADLNPRYARHFLGKADTCAEPVLAGHA